MPQSRSARHLMDRVRCFTIMAMLPAQSLARGVCPPDTGGAPIGRRQYAIFTFPPGRGQSSLLSAQCFRSQLSQRDITFPRSRTDRAWAVCLHLRSKMPEKTSKLIPSSMLLMQLLLSSENSRDLSHARKAVYRSGPYFHDEGALEGNRFQLKSTGSDGVSAALSQGRRAADFRNFFFFKILQGIRVKIQNPGKNWFFWFSLLGGKN